MTPTSLDASIPILTEIIPAPAVSTSANTTAFAGSDEIHAKKPESANVLQTQLMPMAERGRLSDAEWARMEASLRERVLADLMSRIDEPLAERLRDSVTDVTKLIAERLAEDMHHSLCVSLREVVARSVAQEIRRAKTAEN